jgi:predicted nucleotidyltransferase
MEQILLFGSRARGEAGPDSDWDFYVLIGDDLTFAQRQQLVTEIKRELARLRISPTM